MSLTPCPASKRGLLRDQKFHKQIPCFKLKPVGIHVVAGFIGFQMACCLVSLFRLCIAHSSKEGASACAVHTLLCQHYVWYVSA